MSDVQTYEFAIDLSNGKRQLESILGSKRRALPHAKVEAVITGEFIGIIADGKLIDAYEMKFITSTPSDIAQPLVLSQVSIVRTPFFARATQTPPLDTTPAIPWPASKTA